MLLRRPPAVAVAVGITVIVTSGTRQAQMLAASVGVAEVKMARAELARAPVVMLLVVVVDELDEVVVVDEVEVVDDPDEVVEVDEPDEVEVVDEPDEVEVEVVDEVDVVAVVESGLADTRRHCLLPSTVRAGGVKVSRLRMPPMSGTVVMAPAWLVAVLAAFVTMLRIVLRMFPPFAWLTTA